MKVTVAARVPLCRISHLSRVVLSVACCNTMIYSPSELQQLVRTGLRRIFGCGVSRVAPEPDSTSGSASRGSEQVACNEPPSHHQKAHDHAAIPLLAALDDRLVAALQNCAIKLLVADFVRDNTTMLPRILRRQHLEELERSTGARIFFSPSEAVEILRTNARLVAALTYGWCSPDDPDVSGAYLEAVRRYLRSPIGAHVVAIFWDFPSLPQKPRSDVENSYFSGESSDCSNLGLPCDLPDIGPSYGGLHVHV